jgi:hypothetical protein
MPKKNIDYSKTVIYKICCKDLSISNLYIGNTTNLVKRRYQHKVVVLMKKINLIILKYINLFVIMVDLKIGLLLKLINVLVLILKKY